jgi:glucosyl-3-phosphoglycerate synthase
VSLARVAVVIAAANEAERIGATVTAAAALPGVDLVLVGDDGSTDGTGQRAGAAGAVVVTHTRPRGKAAAIDSAVNALGVLEQRDRRPECGSLLLLDADLGSSAAQCASLIAPIRQDQADLVIGVPPHAADGLVATTASRGILELTGWTTRAPASGPRCLTRGAFEVASPLAAGYGVEVGLSIDIVKAGLRVLEIDVDVAGRPPEAGLGGGVQQARQLRDVTRALAARGLIQAGLKDLQDSGGVSQLAKGLLGRLRR